MRVETAPYAVQSVGRQYIEMRSPTSTGLDVVQNLPSVSIAMPDTSGIKGGALYMRGFTDADTALLLDGAPASLAAYLQQNVDAENIESVTMTPGSSPIDAPASNATAGTLDERTLTPERKLGAAWIFLTAPTTCPVNSSDWNPEKSEIPVSGLTSQSQIPIRDNGWVQVQTDGHM